MPTCSIATHAVDCAVSRLTVEAILARHPDGVCGLELRQPNRECWIAILPDPSGSPGTFKVQHFDRGGIGAHDGGYATPEDALRAALLAGYTEAAPGAFNALAASPPWQARYMPALKPRRKSKRRLRGQTASDDDACPATFAAGAPTSGLSPKRPARHPSRLLLV